MRRSVKILAAALAGGLALVALCLAGFARLLDAGTVRDRLSADVQQATGRALAIEAVQIRLFPTPVARLHALRLANAAGFGDEPFASVEEAEVGLRLLPLLLHRAVRVDAVSLRGLQLRLERNADGLGNWADLMTAPARADGSAAQDAAPELEPAPSDFDLAALRIESGSLRFEDAQTGFNRRLDALSVDATRIGHSERFDLALTAASAADDSARKAEFKLLTRLLLDRKQGLVTTEAFKLAVQAGQELRQASAEITGQLRLDLRARQFTAEKLQAGIEALGPEIPEAFRHSQFEADVLYDAAKASLRVASAEWRAAGLSVNFAIDGSELDSEHPRFSGPLIVKPFKPRELLAQLGLSAETRDPAALKDASFRARIEATASAASLRDLVVKLDQSTLTGSAELPSFTPLALQLALKLDTLDVDRYRAPQADHEPESAATPAPEAETPLALDRLDRFSAAGTLDIGKLALAGLRLSALKLRLDAARGQDKRLIATATLYGGSLSSSTHLQRGARGRLAESLQLNAVALAPLLADLGRPQLLSGQGNLLLDLASSGSTVSELRRGLAGDIALEVSDGAVQGLNLAQALRRTLALLHGQAFTDAEAAQTEFSLLTFKGHLAERRLRAEELALRSPLYRVEGSGRADLDAETLAGTLRVTVAEALSGQAAEPLSEIAGLSVPVVISGPWAAPRYAPDLRAAMQQKAAERLHERLGQQLERKLGEGSLKDRLQQGLDSLFGRGRKAPPEPAPTPAPAPSPGIL